MFFFRAIFILALFTVSFVAQGTYASSDYMDQLIDQYPYSSRCCLAA